MNTAIQENCTLIHHLQILQREITLEGEPQLATIAKVFGPHIPLHIEKLQRLNELEKMVPQLIEKIRKLEEQEYGEATA